MFLIALALGKSLPDGPDKLFVPNQTADEGPRIASARPPAGRPAARPACSANRAPSKLPLRPHFEAFVAVELSMLLFLGQEGLNLRPLCHARSCLQPPP